MAKKKKSNALLTLGLLAGGGLLVNEMVKENSGGRSANVNNFFSRQLTTEELKELGNILVSDTRFISSTKGGKGDTGTGIMDLLKIAVPHDSSTPYTKGTVVKTTDSTYLVVDDAPAGTLLTNTAFYYKLHGPDMSGPKGDAFKYSDFTPEQLAALKVKGADGLNAPNWGGSLLRNGAFEQLSTDNWEGVQPPIEVLRGLFVGKPVATNCINLTKFYLPKYRLMKISANVKATGGNAEFRIQLFDKNGAATQNSLTTGSFNYLLTMPSLFSNTEFERKTFYFGGDKTNSFYSASDSAVSGQLKIQNTTGVASFNGLVVSHVDLGEPVPSNLPWKPEGQIVYDVTTGECGRFNGTTIVWFGA
jgi:hypothetical protein